MTAGELAQLITAIATLVASLGGIAIGWHNSGKIEQVKLNTDGLTTKLVDLTATSSKAEGKVEGRIELKAEQRDATS